MSQDQIGASQDAWSGSQRPWQRLWRHVIRMRLRGDSRASPDPALLERRPLYVIGVALMLLALVARQPLLVVAGLLVGVLGAVPEIWYRFGLLGLEISQEPSMRQAALGDEVEIVLTAENRQPLPLPWVEVAQDFPEALAVLGTRARFLGNPERVTLESTFGLWAYQRVRRRLRVRCMQRGAFHLGPLLLRVSDPYGLLVREHQLPQTAVLLVYPLVAPIERLGLPPRAPFGERKSSLRLLEDPLRVAGVRPYMPGDEPRRVHWKATARAGELQSKVYEPATRHTLAIFLDVRTLGRALHGYDPPLAELAITAAASVASWALEQGFAVGLYANGTLVALELDGQTGVGKKDAPGAYKRAAASAAAEPQDGSEAGARGEDRHQLERRIARLTAALRLRVPPASNPVQLTRLLEGLARLLPILGLPMETILAGEQGRLPMGATVVYIGTEAVVDVPLIAALRRLQAVGHTVTLLLTGVARDAHRQTRPHLHLTDMAIYHIGGRETWHELVADVLGQRPAASATSVGGQPAAERASQADENQRGARTVGSPRALVVE